jgi:hypothetical protein
MYIFLIGLVLLLAITGLFWLKDRLESPFFARLAYSELTARLAVVGWALLLIGAVVTVIDLVAYWFA